MHPDTFVEIAKQRLWELDREAERYRLTRSGSRHTSTRRPWPTLKSALYASARMLAGFVIRRAPQQRRQTDTTVIDTLPPVCVCVASDGARHAENRA
jgi:hypothetical protein